MTMADEQRALIAELRGEWRRPDFKPKAMDQAADEIERLARMIDAMTEAAAFSAVELLHKFGLSTDDAKSIVEKT